MVNGTRKKEDTRQVLETTPLLSSPKRRKQILERSRALVVGTEGFNEARG